MEPTRLTAPRNQTIWQCLLLALLLLGAQTLLSVHALDHLDANAPDSCDICLVGSNLNHTHSATATLSAPAIQPSHCRLVPSATPLLHQPAPTPCQRGPPPTLRIV